MLQKVCSIYCPLLYVNVAILSTDTDYLHVLLGTISIKHFPSLLIHRICALS